MISWLKTKQNKTMNPIIAAIQQTMKGIYIILTDRQLLQKKSHITLLKINHYDENLSIIYMIL